MMVLSRKGEKFFAPTDIRNISIPTEKRFDLFFLFFFPSCIFSEITPVPIANTMYGNSDYYPYYFDLP